ncbi:FMN-binding negative transcriptional regulator [Saccharopolyspora erythraea]|uniref:FMN-binding negative transcriptional regulator n=1 Tax=Saccharopolyspora erythraea TaxID=1836 RepID=UPI001BAB375C|nr:FMN-binding negative transcriptional regulator [Saccharopolyspora erythraea]QUH04394.1 FMN-binding negative transcriptional regulator [Saccharopolyspora erythraea]
MHVFDRYAAPSKSAEVDLVRRHPFAVVVSAEGTGAPVGSHVPVVFPQDRPPPGVLDGTTLPGHMARSNPQWRSFTAGREVLLVFSGPHGYVSPSAYGFEPAVPTLNYAAVHVTGSVDLVGDAAGCLRVVEETVRALEDLRDPAWDMTASREKFAALAGHVVAFRVRVTSVRSTFKLSQDMPPDVRARVRADLRGAHPHLAELMAAHDPG